MKQITVFPTKKQVEATRLIAEEHMPVSRAMRQAGYAQFTAKRPDNLTESIGFKRLMANYGLTQELVASSLTEDIKAKPKNRTPELSLAANILRMTGKGEESMNFIPIKIEIHATSS